MSSLKYTLVLLFLTPLNLLSQTILVKDSFFLPEKTFSANYKSIVGDPKGWRAIGHYNLYTNKVDLHLSPWDTLSVFTPFKDGSGFTKISRHKIIGRGDKRTVAKIVYVSETMLLLQHKRLEKINHKRKHVKFRTMYRRKT